LKRVLRYRIDLDDRPSEIGVGKVLLAQPIRLSPDQPWQLDVWVEVTPPARWPQFPEKKHRVKVVSTGQPFSQSLKHLISCSVGLEIFHIYEWL
jgi:hypothetical protein